MPPDAERASSVRGVLGYQNQYGTGVEGSYDPGSQDLRGEVRFPIGDHQSGRYFSAEGGYNPEQGANAMLRIGRKNVPEVSPRQLEEAVSQEGGMAAQMMKENNPELYATYLEKLRRQKVDEAMGIGVPGRDRYSVYMGLKPGEGMQPRGQFVPDGRFAGDRKEEVGPLLLRGAADLMEAGGRR